MHQVPRKVLRYFPIKKRLQRLFISKKSATDARWHDEGRIRDGLVRHPTDSPAWKHFDATHPKFAEDSRNIRLAIMADGFNPYRSMYCSSYSIWPVMLIPLNLPPWYSVVQSIPGILYDIFGKGNENFEKVDEHVVLFPDLDANVDLRVDLRSAPRIREDINGTIVRQVKKDKYVVFSF